jgi:hypothetical protein
MRFILLARARATGILRLLSDRAFDSQTAAVDAATVTAHSIELGDDEVLAVDLDKAGPVLVLRIEVPARETATPPEPAAEGALGWSTPVAPAEAPVSGVLDPAAFSSETVVRLEPRFPLFGGEDENVGEETLAEALRRVARRMEEVTRESDEEYVSGAERPDAPTVDQYSIEDGPELLGAREEGRVRGDAADLLYLLYDMDAVRLSDAIGFRYTNGDAWPAAEEAPPAGEVEAAEVPAPPAEEAAEEVAPPADEVADISAALPAEEIEADQVEVACDVAPEPPEEPAAQEPVFAEPAVGEIVPVEEVVVSEEPATVEEVVPVEDSAQAEEAHDAETVILVDQVFPAQEAPGAPLFAESEPYSPSNVDFSLWVCADCVYQRTCRKAGVATPATCGNFQWR